MIEFVRINKVHFFKRGAKCQITATVGKLQPKQKLWNALVLMLQHERGLTEFS